MLTATVSVAEAAQRRWEFLVIGSGPAGAFAARQLAHAGRSVLVLEKKSFPRVKVCGGCVGPEALKLMRNAGLGDEIAALPQTTAAAIHLHAGGRSARLPVRPLQVIAREDLDACLIRAAIRSGAHFLPETTAIVGPVSANERVVDCRSPDLGEFKLTGAIVVAADGLAHTCLQRLTEFRDQIASRSHVGLGTIVTEDDAWCASAEIAPGAVQMAVAPNGYVGIARGACRRLHIAAAVRPELLRRRTPAEVVGELLHSAGKPIWEERARNHWKHADWCGTPPLTHRLNRMSAERLLVLGDAAAYVEPFTGEGIHWALHGAGLLARCAERSCNSAFADLQHAWQAEYSPGLAQRSRNCRLVAALLRTPWPPAWTIAALDAWPSLAGLLVRRLNRSWAAAGLS